MKVPIPACNLVSRLGNDLKGLALTRAYRAGIDSFRIAPSGPPFWYPFSPPPTPFPFCSDLPYCLHLLEDFKKPEVGPYPPASAPEAADICPDISAQLTASSVTNRRTMVRTKSGSTWCHWIFPGRQSRDRAL